MGDPALHLFLTISMALFPTPCAGTGLHAVGQNVYNMPPFVKRLGGVGWLF